MIASFIIRVLCGIFGHCKTYVGVVDVVVKDGPAEEKCAHGYFFRTHCAVCTSSVQIARWVCASCPKMGEDYIRRGEGIFKVHMGALEPDCKRWANEVAR